MVGGGKGLEVLFLRSYPKKLKLTNYSLRRLSSERAQSTSPFFQGKGLILHHVPLERDVSLLRWGIHGPPPPPNHQSEDRSRGAEFQLWNPRQKRCSCPKFPGQVSTGRKGYFQAVPGGRQILECPLKRKKPPAPVRDPGAAASPLEGLAEDGAGEHSPVLTLIYSKGSPLLICS